MQDSDLIIQGDDDTSRVGDNQFFPGSFINDIGRDDFHENNDIEAFIFSIPQREGQVLLLKLLGYKPVEIVKIANLKSIGMYYIINRELQILFKNYKKR